MSAPKYAPRMPPQPSSTYTHVSPKRSRNGRINKTEATEPASEQPSHPSPASGRIPKLWSKPSPHAQIIPGRANASGNRCIRQAIPLTVTSHRPATISVHRSASNSATNVSSQVCHVSANPSFKSTSFAQNPPEPAPIVHPERVIRREGRDGCNLPLPKAPWADSSPFPTPPTTTHLPVNRCVERRSSALYFSLPLRLAWG